MTTRMLAALALIAFLTVPLGDTLAHSGGTNAAGCHTNWATGDYHCHRAKSPSYGYTTYCHVLYGQNRCGYALSTCRQLVRALGGYCAMN